MQGSFEGFGGSQGGLFADERCTSTFVHLCTCGARQGQRLIFKDLQLFARVSC